MNLLITGAWTGAKDYINQIENAGHAVVFMQYEKDDLPCTYEWVEGVICNGLFLSHPIEKFVNLKYIQLTSAGFDRVPMDYVQQNEIEIHSARGVYSIPMAEYTITGVLQLYKKMNYFRESQKRHEWNKHRGLIELFGKTVCIVGCGSVGTECAKRFQAFGCNVLGVDLYPREDTYYSRMEGLSELDNMLIESDVVVLTLPLTDETKHLMNHDRFGKMKRNAILVNIARGAVVDMDALIVSIENLGGVVLDVFEEEPLEEESSLWDMEKVIVTPHNCFVGDGNMKRLEQIILEGIQKLNCEEKMK